MTNGGGYEGLRERILFEVNLLGLLPDTHLEEKCATIDVRHDPGIVSMPVSPAEEGRGGVDRTVATVRPMLVGAAWKVLDQIVEHQLNMRPGEYRSIRSKRNSALSHSVPSPFPGEYRKMWHGVLDAYDAYAEVRHGLMHRTSYADPDGDLMTPLDDGTPTSVTLVEQSALCRLACGLADVLLLPRVDYNQHADLGQQLNQLSRVSRGDWPARDRAERMEFVDVFSPGNPPSYTIKREWIEHRVFRSQPNATSIDVLLQIDPSESVYLAGPLEFAPATPVVITRADHPDWLAEQVRPELS